MATANFPAQSMKQALPYDNDGDGFITMDEFNGHVAPKFYFEQLDSDLDGYKKKKFYFIKKRNSTWSS